MPHMGRDKLHKPPQRNPEFFRKVHHENIGMSHSFEEHRAIISRYCLCEWRACSTKFENKYC